MKPADPRKHLRRGGTDRRCWSCAAFSQPDHWPDTAQPLGDCGLIEWMMPVDGKSARQMVHADDVCAKHVPVERTLDQREERALMAGLG